LHKSAIWTTQKLIKQKIENKNYDITLLVVLGLRFTRMPMIQIFV